jgi:5-(carboxyamino)imidazole ribonucleotide synthase
MLHRATPPIAHRVRIVFIVFIAHIMFIAHIAHIAHMWRIAHIARAVGALADPSAARKMPGPLAGIDFRSLESPMKLGILGGGQLGRMLALAGVPLGVRCRVLEPAADPPAAAVAEHIPGDFDDFQALYRLHDVDAVTYEFENVPVESARWLAERLPVFPPPAALAVAQDRLAEKAFFARHGIPTPPFAGVEGRAEFEAALAHIGLPAVLKTRRFGYDGKGQMVLRTPTEAEEGWRVLGGRPLILEGFVSFERELSVLAVRGRDGSTACYPLVENRHHEGILRLSLAPAPRLTPGLQAQAEAHARRALDELAYVGVLAIEFFEVAGRLLANEIAPRVHNSGHWTIEGAECSQFENHLRAVLGWPLGSTAAVGCSAMVNLIGTLPPAEAVLAVPGAHLHLYGKSPRPRRKLGHVTVCARHPEALADLLTRLPGAADRATS